MVYVVASVRTRCVAVLAVIALHVLLLACLLSLPSPGGSRQPDQAQLLTVILTPADKQQSLPPDTSRQSQHARPLSQASGKLPLPSRHTKAMIETPKRQVNLEEAVQKAPTPEETENTSASKPSDAPYDVRSDRQASDWKSNAGALDQRWLPRHADAVQADPARPRLGEPKDENKLEQAVSRSSRADCRTRYAHMGLLAIPFLLNDTASDKGCKW
jgi:hypothetical protein